MGEKEDRGSLGESDKERVGYSEPPNPRFHVELWHGIVFNLECLLLGTTG